MWEEASWMWWWLVGVERCWWDVVYDASSERRGVYSTPLYIDDVWCLLTTFSSYFGLRNVVTPADLHLVPRLVNWSPMSFRMVIFVLQGSVLMRGNTCWVLSGSRYVSTTTANTVLYASGSVYRQLLANILSSNPWRKYSELLNGFDFVRVRPSQHVTCGGMETNMSKEGQNIREGRWSSTKVMEFEGLKKCS